MVNILLVCTAGLSMMEMVKRMKKAAEDQGVEAHIWSAGEAASKEAMQEADIVLLAPQVSFMEEKTKEAVNNRIPVAVIDTRVYGTMNGELALDTALEALEAFKQEN